MQKLILLFFPFLVLKSLAHNQWINNDIVQQIKARTDAWVPLDPRKNPLSKLTDLELRSKLGLKASKSPLQQSGKAAISPSSSKKTSGSLLDLPMQFDARNKWSGCIQPVRDQGGCGSCWAFASAGQLSDRYCIKSGGSINKQLSYQELVECMDPDEYGCNGAYIDVTLQYLETNGISSDNCIPYTAGNGLLEACSTQCVQSSTDTFDKYKCAAGSSKSLSGEVNFKNELVKRGPFAVTFTVYQDFMNYGGGVYYHTTGPVVGYHAVKIIGYGVSRGLRYYLCQNQWGTAWGEKGFFRIKVGDSAIDQDGYACSPDL